MSLDDTMAFTNQLPRAGYPWIGTGVESRHQTLYPALWTFEITFYPSDDSPSAATISQDTTKFSNWWVPEVDVGSQQ